MARPQKELLQAMSEQEEREVQRLVKPTSKPLDVVSRAKVFVAVGSGKFFTEAASEADLERGKGVSQRVKFFNTHGLAALSISAGLGHNATYTSEQHARMLAEVRRKPNREEKNQTATRSLILLRTTLRNEGQPHMAREMIRQALHEGAIAISIRVRGRVLVLRCGSARAARKPHTTRCQKYHTSIESQTLVQLTQSMPII